MTYIPEALRRLVTERAGGRCAYCRLHEDDTFFIHEVDHIYAEKHDGPTVEGNLCIACADCNRILSIIAVATGDRSTKVW